MAAATMAGGELGILCFFESQPQEQCRFLWVSPPPPSAAQLFLLQTHCRGCGERPGGVSDPGRHGPAGPTPPLPPGVATGQGLPLSGLSTRGGNGARTQGARSGHR